MTVKYLLTFCVTGVGCLIQNVEAKQATNIFFFSLLVREPLRILLNVTL